MRITTTVLGLQDVLNNTQGAKRAVAAAVSRSLRRAGLILQRQSQLQVPVNFGILKASAFTRATGKGFDTVVTVGYTAAYAIFVHENRKIWPPGMRLKGKPRVATTGQKSGKGRYWDPQGRAKPDFLIDPFRQFARPLNQITKDNVSKAIREFRARQR